MDPNSTLKECLKNIYNSTHKINGILFNTFLYVTILKAVKKRKKKKQGTISSTTHVQLLQWLHGKQQQHVPISNSLSI